ncbi:MAG: hypothetical protein NW206_02990 [Hyphomonadaceae bacterium]|nr:hypothetical protein [Hyphomonadaceae bacterium]
MRNAQKTAVMALFASMEAAKDSPLPAPRREPSLLGKPAARDIQLDPLWLITRGSKGRA